MADESLFLRKSPRYNKTHQGTTRHNEDIAFERSSLFTSPTRERNTFFCSSSQSRFELASTTSPSSYQPRSYPYQSNLTFPKYQRRVFDYLEDEMPPWSMANPPRRRQLLPSRTVLAESERNPKVNESSSETMHERTEEHGQDTRSEPRSISFAKRTRTTFTPVQLLVLETAFEKNHYVVGCERKQLAMYLKLTEIQVKVWFQNRRTKWKKTVLRPY